ncbi:MAG: TetR/AcrR family transcriptional regulator [Firmicutes bacterium]|nr:TetR/AcrR family transcriptional regulator [Bacillota bacterium]
MQYKKKFINDRILEAGLNEYLEKGYRGGNISTIAQNAGVPVGNLYRYFDGKSGLLDALVKKPYQEFPKIVDQLARIDVETSLPLKDVMVRLTQMLLNIFEQYGKEIIILADKCATTRYEDFIEKVAAQIADLVYKKIYNDDSDLSRMMSNLATTAFIDSILQLLRLDLERSVLEAMILRVMNFYFYAIDVRK